MPPADEGSAVTGWGLVMVCNSGTEMFRWSSVGDMRMSIVTRH
jgi:hypothetical protein